MSQFTYKHADLQPGHVMQTRRLGVPPGIALSFGKMLADYYGPLSNGSVVMVNVPSDVEITMSFRTTDEIRAIDAEDEKKREAARSGT